MGENSDPPSNELMSIHHSEIAGMQSMDRCMPETTFVDAHPDPHGQDVNVGDLVLQGRDSKLSSFENHPPMNLQPSSMESQESRHPSFDAQDCDSEELEEGRQQTSLSGEHRHLQVPVLGKPKKPSFFAVVNSVNRNRWMATAGTIVFDPGCKFCRTEVSVSPVFTDFLTYLHFQCTFPCWFYRKTG